jgi:hypothetical protein
LALFDTYQPSGKRLGSAGGLSDPLSTNFTLGLLSGFQSSLWHSLQRFRLGSAQLSNWLPEPHGRPKWLIFCFAGRFVLVLNNSLCGHVFALAEHFIYPIPF